MPQQARNRRNLLAVNLGLAVNIVLAVAKTSVGILGHSPALLADGINSTSDAVYLVIVRIFMRLAGKPPDREHPFGHHQLESISALIIGAFVITTAVAIFWSAINSTFELATGERHIEGAHIAAFWVALATLVVKIGLTTFTYRIARETKSIAVRALARDHQNDVYSITTAGVGIFLSQAGYVWLDPLAAALVAVFILRTGIDILRDSSAELMNIFPGDSMAPEIRGLLEAIEGVDDVEDIHVHRIGLYLLVDVTIGVDGTLSVAQGDQIASRVEEALWEGIEYLRRVTVHYHPAKQP